MKKLLLAAACLAGLSLTACDEAAPEPRIKSFVTLNGGLVACANKDDLMKVYIGKTAGDMMVQAALADCLILKAGAEFYPDVCISGAMAWCQGRMIGFPGKEYYVMSPLIFVDQSKFSIAYD